MSSVAFETSITAQEINEFDFRPGDLDCSICHKFYEKFCFHHIFMAKYIEKLKRWRISHIGLKPKITCINCYRKNPNPLIVFKCCGCGIEKPLYNFPKNKKGPNDYLSCIACFRKYKKDPASYKGKFKNLENSSASNPLKKVAPIEHSKLTHYDPEYNYSIPTFESSLSKSKKPNFEMPRTEPLRSDYSDSAYSSISNFSDLTTSNQQASYIQDNLNYSLSQSSANPLYIDRNKGIFQPQVQQQQPQYFKNLNIPKFDTNIYSLSQLIGRKNPTITNHNTISLTIPNEYRTRDSCNINTESGSSSSASPQYDADLTYKQNTSQISSYNYENIDLYTRQIVNSIQDISNNEQNAANTEPDLTSNKQAGITGILKYTHLVRDNNGTGTASDERPAYTKPKQVRFNLPGDPNGNFGNGSQTNTIASTAEYSNQTEKTATQTPNNINNTIQTNSPQHNLLVPSTSSTNLSPSITTGRYRNKNFNLSEIFGTAYNPLPIPLPSNSLSDSNHAFRVNPYISKNHTQITIQKDNINLQALNPALNNPIRFGFSNTGGATKRNFTNFSGS
jgi:hypothetical protein